MSNQPKIELNKFYLLTHPFFTASRMPAHTEKEKAAREVVSRVSVKVWHWLVDKVASEPGSALIVVSAGDLGKLDRLWGEFSSYTKEKLGDRFFRTSKADKLLESHAHKFSESSFYGTMKSKHFKFSGDGVSIEGFGEPNRLLCLEPDIIALKGCLCRRGIRILDVKKNEKIRIPSPKRAREVGARLRRRSQSAQHRLENKPGRATRRHRG